MAMGVSLHEARLGLCDFLSVIFNSLRVTQVFLSGFVWGQVAFKRCKYLCYSIDWHLFLSLVYIPD